MNYITFLIRKIFNCVIIFFMISSNYLIAQSDTMVDPRDGKVYRTIKMGSQIWMAENLTYATHNSFIGDSAFKYDLNNILHIYCYNDDTVNCKKFGMLYDWGPAQNACPVGWHLPSESEFDTLLAFVEVPTGSKNSRAKQVYTSLIDDSGFAALHAGLNSLSMKGYHFIGRIGFFWSSTEKNKYDAKSLIVSRTHSRVCVSIFHKSDAMSVRCIKD